MIFHFFIFFALLFNFSDPSTQVAPYVIRKCEPFKWSNYEISVSKQFKDSVLNTFRPMYTKFSGEHPTNLPGNFTDSFHFVELNGDGRVDLIYQGWTGGEGTIVDFYINTGKSYKKVFSDFMELLDLHLEKKKLISFVIYNPGCCAEMVQFERHYQVSPQFDCKLQWQGAILEGMSAFERKIEPDSFFGNQFQFQTLNEDYALRYQPLISDTAPVEIWEALPDNRKPRGNIVAVFPKGAIGTAWAHKTDSTGREWWLVEMKPLKYLKFDAYYELDDFPTHYIGWMSSRFVKRIE